MKQINSVVTLCCIAVFLLIVASCKKGDTGPAGPAGPTGPNGANGPAGAKGDTGVANVIYSDWLDVPFTQDPSSMNWVANIPAPKLDINIVNKGDIKVYCNFGIPSSPFIVSLPYFDGNDILNVYFEVGFIDLLSTSNYSTGLDPDSGEKGYQYRYILIPGGKAARSAIDWNNYAEVKKYLNLKD